MIDGGQKSKKPLILAALTAVGGLVSAAGAYWKYETEKLAAKTEISTQQVYTDDALKTVTTELDRLRETQWGLKSDIRVLKLEIEYLKDDHHVATTEPLDASSGGTAMTTLVPTEGPPAPTPPRPAKLELPSRKKYAEDPRVQQQIQLSDW